MLGEVTCRSELMKSEQYYFQCSKAIILLQGTFRTEAHTMLSSPYLLLHYLFGYASDTVQVTRFEYRPSEVSQGNMK
jgi:hypothetical protein